MRLLIVGTLKGQLTTATKIAMDNGAAVTHAGTSDQALAVLRSGNAGSVYFLVNGQAYGPAAPGPQVVKNVALTEEALKGKYAVADLEDDADLKRIVAVAEVLPENGAPQE